MSREQQGLVVETQRRHFLVELDGAPQRCIARGRDLSIACGDWVTVVPSHAGDPAIVSVQARSSVFYRADEFKQKIVAANVTQVVCVLACDPPYAPILLDRWLVAAHAADVRSVIVFNKMDLRDAQATLDALKAQAYALGSVIVGVSATHDVDALRAHLHGHRSVLIGQSGMGKSTVLNALVGEDVRAVGELSAVRAAGTHTTTHSKLFHLDRDSWVIDSPGMQVFGLAHVKRAEVVAAFPELESARGECRFRNCAHAQEPDCAVQLRFKQGKISPSRFQNFQLLFAEANE
jgi:ribosome biogenesis GTPase / thiamine phosphate phosphatase